MWKSSCVGIHQLLNFWSITKYESIKKMHVQDKWKVTESGRVIEETHKYTKTQWIKDKSEEEKKFIFQAKWFGIDENKFCTVLSLPNSA